MSDRTGDAVVVGGDVVAARGLLATSSHLNESVAAALSSRVQQPTKVKETLKGDGNTKLLTPKAGRGLGLTRSCTG